MSFVVEVVDGEMRRIGLGNCMKQMAIRMNKTTVGTETSCSWNKMAI